MADFKSCIPSDWILTRFSDDRIDIEKYDEKLRITHLRHVHRSNSSDFGRNMLFLLCDDLLKKDGQ